MPPLRKTDRRSRFEQQAMTEIRMSAASTTTSLHENTETYVERPPYSHPVYGNFRENVPLVQPSLIRRPGLSDPHTRALSDLMTESIQYSPLETPNGGFPPFAPRAASSYSEAGTRISSPFPAASTPFVCCSRGSWGEIYILTLHREVKKH